MRFCGQCGAALAPRPDSAGERRPLTVLFCDMVGSTPLAAALDPEDLRQVLLAFREACGGSIERRGGTIGQYLGDGILAYFGFPRAREDDAARAVRAALLARDAMGAANARLAAAGIVLPRPLQARFGVHTGTLVVGDLGYGRQIEPAAIVGETTSIAARLQAVAAPGQVLVSAATARLAGRSLLLEERGQFALAGLLRPVQAFEAVGVRPHADGPGPPAPDLPFLAREDELRRLGALWLHAIENRGSVAVVEAEAGMGKTRLVLEFRRQVVGDAPTVRLACAADDQATAYQPLLSWLMVRLALGTEADGAARRAGLHAALAAAGIDLAQHGPPLAALLDCALPEDSAALADTPARRRRRLTRALITLLTARPAGQPLLLLAEDLHWADSSTLDLLDALAAECTAPGAPATLLLLTSRPAASDRPDIPAARLRLDRLSDADAMALARAAAPPGTAAAVLEEIVRRTDGVPLFAEEVARAARPEEGAAADAVPMTLHSALAAQLDGLAGAKRVAQAASVIGRSFQFDLLDAALDEADRPGLPAALCALVAARFITPERRAGEATAYVFRHALIRDAAYGSLLREPRRAMHLHVAEALRARFPETAALRPELVARHYGAAGRKRDAAEYYEIAARRAAARSTHAEAAEHCRVALLLLQCATEVPDRTAREFRMQVALAAQITAMRGNGDPGVSAAFQKAMEAAERLGERRGLRRALRGLHTFHLVRGDIGAGRAISERVMALGADVTDPGERMQLHRPHGLTLLYLGRFEDARRELRTALSLYDPDRHADQRFEYGSDPGVLSRCHLGWAESFLGNDGLAEGAAAVAAARALAHPHSLAFALAFQACLHQFAGDPSAALPAVVELERLSERHDYAYWRAWAEIVRGWAEAALGGAGGEALLRQGIERYEATGAGLMSPYANWLLAGLVAQRDPAAAAALLARAAAQAEAGEMGIWLTLFGRAGR